jgi:predicted kinase
MLEVVMLMGLPGAGKSSFFRARFAATHVHISKDLWPSTRNKMARQRREIRAALEAGKNVVVDNTHVTRARRIEVFEAIQDFQTRVVGFFFASNLDECLARNTAREGRARVPDVALHVMRADLQIPSCDEGFDELYFVALGAPSEFLISKWNEEFFQS